MSGSFDLNTVFGALLMMVGLTDVFIALGVLRVSRVLQNTPMVRALLLGMGCMLFLGGTMLVLGFYRFL